MNGRDYRAKVRLSTGADETLAETGETCERIPEASLAWLLEQGLIAPIAPVVEELHEHRGADVLDALRADGGGTEGGGE